MSKSIKKNFFAPLASGLGAMRRATMLLLATLLLTMTAQTAWADNLTSANLLIDSEITEGTAGHYYYTMPRVCNNTLTITEQDISDGKGTFNVYDCGGKNHDQDWYNLNEALVITAPLGYAVKITGTAKTDDNQYQGSEYLSVYDGTSTSGAYLGRFGTTSHSEYYNVDVQSSSNSIMLEFVTSMWNIKGRGLNLTVSLVEEQYSISFATINIEKYHRYTGSAVDLGYTVDDSKGNRLTQGTHYNATIKNNNGEVVQSAISEGHYTLTIEGISPYSGSKTVDFWVNENPGVLIDSDIAEGTLGHFFSLMPKSGSATVDLTQSDVATLMIYDDGGKGGGYDSNTPGNFTPKANGYLLLHAPAGFQIHLTGHVRTKSAKAYLTVHNGNTESAPTLCANVHGVNSSAGTSTYKDVTVDVISTGEYMLLHFDAGALTWGWDSEGLILTASIGHSITVDDGITHGSVSCDNFWIKGSSTTIPLTVTPDVGYRTNTVSYNDGTDHTLTADGNGDYSFTMPSKEVTVSATFVPITYTVSFNANGGTGDAMSVMNFTYDVAQNLSANTYTRTGYVFAGWATTADGDVVYGDLAEVSNRATTQGTNVELFAKWNIVTYNITYNGVEGATNTNPATYTIESQDITLDAPTKDGYTFAGWYGNSGFTGDAITSISSGSTGDKTFWAKWKKLMTNTDISITIPEQTYTGSALTPVITVKDGETVLTETTDYTVTAPSGTVQNAGNYIYTITGAGNYTGETTATFTIAQKAVTGTGISIDIPSQEWTGGALTFDANAVIVKDGETTLTQNTHYTVTAPSGTIQDAGEYTYTITGAGNYSGETTAKFTIVPKTVTVNNGGGDVPAATGDATITQDQNGVTLTLITPAEDVTPQAVSIPTAVEVDHVDLERTFPAGKAATVYLPFSIAAAKVVGGKFHTFTGVDMTKEPWEVTYTEVTGNIGANTPYIFLPDGTNGGKIVVNNGSDKITVGTNIASQEQKVGQWEFIGTYEPITWTADHADLGKVYGFAGENRNGASIGQFVKASAGAHIKPRRAYLKYSGTSGARAASRSVMDDLPSMMIVVLAGSDGQTTEIGTFTLDYESGDWYSLDGRKLNNKPTKKGLYIHNGRKEVIK